MLNVRRFSPKIVVFLGSGISIAGILASSYTKDMNAFIALFGLCFGLGGGMTYLVPLQVGWEYFPLRKGLVTGIVIGAYGMGSSIFSQISTGIINPDNEKATIFINEDFSYFEESVASRVPRCLQILSIIWTC